MHDCCGARTSNLVHPLCPWVPLELPGRCFVELAGRWRHLRPSVGVRDRVPGVRDKGTPGTGQPGSGPESRRRRKQESEEQGYGDNQQRGAAE